jgi:hypothetical protein
VAKVDGFGEMRRLYRKQANTVKTIIIIIIIRRRRRRRIKIIIRIRIIMI